MSTVIPNPADYIFKDEPVETAPETNTSEVDMDMYDWDTFTIGGKSVVDELVKTLSNLIATSAAAFKKDGEINLTFDDLFEVIDNMGDYDEEKDRNENVELFVDDCGYTYKQYCIEAALDKLTEAGWNVDVEYADFIKKDDVSDTTKKCVTVFKSDPLLKAIFFPEDGEQIDLDEAMWIAANEVESGTSVITISPEVNDEEDDDTAEPPVEAACTQEDREKADAKAEEHADDTNEYKPTGLLKEIIDEFRALLG